MTTNSVVSNPKQFVNRLDSFVTKFEKEWKKRNRRIMEEGMLRLLRRTPVHTGQAVANYVATNGSPYAGPVKSGYAVKEQTNKLPLGAEQNRPPAEAVAKATLSGVNYTNPYDVFYITNRAPHIAGLEYGGLLPEPFRSRSPNGMFGVTLQELVSLLESKRI